MAEANEVISPRLGFPELPVVEWADGAEEPEHGLRWKTVLLTQWAAGRPFVWFIVAELRPPGLSTWTNVERAFGWCGCVGAMTMAQIRDTSPR